MKTFLFVENTQIEHLNKINIFRSGNHEFQCGNWVTYLSRSTIEFDMWKCGTQS